MEKGVELILQHILYIINQWIEHIWRDVWNYAGSQFYYISQTMEDEG